MAISFRTFTPAGVDRILTAAAHSVDGLVICVECRRRVSDLGTTCPHCGGEIAIPESNKDTSVAPTHRDSPDRISFLTRPGVIPVLLLAIGVLGYLLSLLIGR